MVESSSGTSKAIEIMQDKLYWISDEQPPKNQANAFFFNIDNDLVYEPLSSDFGPLDLGKTYRFVTELEKLIQDPDPALAQSKFFHHTSLDNVQRTNAACLMGCFQVIILGRTAEEAWEPFSKVEPALADYPGADYTNSLYRCTILDCLRGLEYAIKLQWFDVRKFNLKDYEFYEKVANGDLNWIVPGKFIGFSGPWATPKHSDGASRFTPEDYVPIFKKNGVSMVIRLNKKEYEEDRFTKHGIKHKDLFFLDGSCPTDEIIEEFISTAEQEEGTIAVHCKSGMARTGTMIACYAMKHYRFAAADFIGWIRLARPGSIAGPQQQFLCDKESYFHKMCENSSIYKSIYPSVKEFWERRENLLVQQMLKVSPGITSLDSSKL